MNMKHTPGPWDVEIRDGMTMRYAVVLVPNLEPFEVDGHTEEEELANARLIAAAPDLLEALQGMLDGYDDSYTQDGAPNKAARAAIARATGKESA